MRNFLIFFILIFCNFIINADTIIANRVAKVGNEIILKSDVEKYAKVNNLTFDKAKQVLIEKAILYTAAKMYVDEPSDDEVNAAFLQLKRDYASKIGKDSKKVSDEEVVTLLNYNNLSLITFKNELKKEVWTNKYLNMVYKQKIMTSYFPNDDEIQKFIKDNPSIFEEGEGCYLSMIYFSYYNDDGKIKSENEINNLTALSEECLNKLKNGSKFEDMVEMYSTDLISKNETPKGKIGRILFDDPRVQIRFSEEIISNLKNSKEGIILKTLKSTYGIYIFKIDGKIPPQKIEGKASEIKAKDYIQKMHRIEMEQKVLKELIEEIKKKISFIEY